MHQCEPELPIARVSCNRSRKTTLEAWRPEEAEDYSAAPKCFVLAR
jgi:hypothetical protein